MLTTRELLILKEKYSGHKLIYVRFSNNEYVFRNLSLKEYRYIKMLYTDKYELEDTVCNVACVYPENMSFEYCGFAGVVEKCSSLVIEHSGVENPFYLMNKYNELKDLDSLEGQCMDLIKAFIGDYSYEEMEEWPYDRLVVMTIKAIRVAKFKGFDWSLTFPEMPSEESIEETASLDNDKFTDSLIKDGIDPMMFFSDNLDEMFEQERESAFPDMPTITGNRWNNEEVLNAIRRQTYNAQIGRQAWNAQEERDTPIRTV